MMEFFGFRVSKSKEIEPRPDHRAPRGFTMDLKTWTAYVPEQKVMQLKRLGQELLEQCHEAPGRLLARFIDKLRSFRTACPEVIVLARGMQRCLLSLPTESRLAEAKNGDMFEFQWQEFSGSAVLSDLGVAELRMWLAGIWKPHATVSSHRIEVTQLVEVTGSVQKGQGHNQLETGAYWAFLVERRNLQCYIPVTIRFRRVSGPFGR